MVLDKTRPAIRNTLWLPQELSVGPSLSGFGLRCRYVGIKRPELVDKLLQQDVENGTVYRPRQSHRLSSHNSKKVLSTVYVGGSIPAIVLMFLRMLQEQHLLLKADGTTHARWLTFR